MVTYPTCNICGTRIFKNRHWFIWLHCDSEIAEEKAGFIHEAVLKVTRRGPAPDPERLKLDPS